MKLYKYPSYRATIYALMIQGAPSSVAQTRRTPPDQESIPGPPRSTVQVWSGQGWKGLTRTSHELSRCKQHCEIHYKLQMGHNKMIINFPQ